MKTLLTMLATLTLIGGVAAAQTATVQVIHNSPDPAASTVDIYIGMGTTEPAIPDFAYRTATGLVDLPADVELMIGVAPGNSMDSGDVLAWFPVTLPAGSKTVVMATGVLDPMSVTNPDGVSTGFTLAVNELVTMASAGNVGLLAYHGSPDAPTVDVVAAGVGVLVPGLTYTDFAGYLEVPAATYTLQVTPAGVNESVLFQYEAPLDALGGGTAVVFASGTLADFGLYAALNDGTVIELPVTTVANEDMSMGALKASFR